MIDILLFQPAVESDTGFYYSAISNGLMALGMYLKSQSVNARIVHFNGANSLEQRVKEKVRQHRPRIVGVNLTWHTHAYQGLEIASYVKEENDGIGIVFGGYTSGFFDGDILETSKKYGVSDALVIRGDAEEPFLEFIKTGEFPNTNTSFMRGGTLVKNPITYVQDELPKVRLDYSVTELVENWEDYLKRGGIRTSVPGIEGKVGHNVGSGEFDLYIGKGCRNACVYCGGGREAHKLLAGRIEISYRDPNDVVVDITQLERDDVKILYMDFDPHPRRTFYRELLEIMNPCSMGTMFSAWSGPLDERLLDLFEEKFQGGVEIVISPDTGSERLRQELIERGHGKTPFYTNKQLIGFFRELQRRNFKAMCYFITGLPWENSEDKRETQELARTLRNEFPTLFRKSHDPRIERNLCAPPMYTEPASPISVNPDKFDMILSRRNFDDYSTNSANPKQNPLGVHHKKFSSEDEVLKQSCELTKIVIGDDKNG